MSKYAAFGAKLVYDPASSNLDVAQITNISGPGISTDAIDVTAHDSAAGTREFLPGLVDAGEVTVELFFDAEASAGTGADSGLNVLEKKAQDRSTNTWQIVNATSTDMYRRFSGIVTAFSFSSPVDGAITASATIKLTGIISTGTA